MTNLAAGSLAATATDEIMRRRGELAYYAQMAALEQLPVADDVRAELLALDGELKRRGVDPTRSL